MTVVAITSRSFTRHPVLRRELIERYPEARFNDDGLKLAGPQLIDFLDGAEKAITALECLNEALFQALPGLKVVSKYGVGIDMIDLDAMARHGVRLGFTPGVNRRAVAELVISFAIALLRHVPRANAEVLAGDWHQIMGRQLSGRSVGIIGCGNIGKLLGRLLRAFGCRVLAHDILDFPDYFAETGVEPVALVDLLRVADVVTLHLPLDPSTEYILDAGRLALMKPDAILINTARGGLVDEGALKQMLKRGRLVGAAFDVFAEEPPVDRELLQMPNMLATPHIGGSSEEAVLNMGRAAIAGLDDYGDPLEITAKG
jgi:D-3-phosphoglycerate dehydrogenase